MKRYLTLLYLLLLAGTAHAEWVLAPGSSYVGFASVKNEVVAENHHFTSLNGRLGDDGQLYVVISLASVETLIPIRNERMRSMLFEVHKSPVAVVNSQVPLDEFLALPLGGSKTSKIPFTLELHGQKVDREVEVKVTRSGQNQYEAATVGPIMLNAADFDLSAGVEALRKVVGLDSIAPIVPVTFTLTFVDPQIQ